ncbi:MAG: T9SS type A sorting domain-containing protein [Bacteroidia bacterium]
MKQNFTRIFLVGMLAVLGIFSQVNAAGPMKDIELDPDKGDNKGNFMQAFPTIASSQVSVRFYFEHEGDVTLSVYDMQGRSVDTGAKGHIPAARMHESVIDASNLLNGVYFVKLTHADGTAKVAKIVVQH